MNFQTVNRASTAAAGFLLVSVMFAVIVVALKLTLSVPAVDEVRAQERVKALSEIRAAEEKSLVTAGWIDQTRGLVRLPIETAMRLSAQLGQNPAAVRADLNARSARSVAPVAAKPSAFE